MWICSGASMMTSCRPAPFHTSQRFSPHNQDDSISYTVAPCWHTAAALAGRDAGIARLVLQGLWEAAVTELGAKGRKGEGPLQSLRAALAEAFAAGPTEPHLVQTLQVPSTAIS